MSHDDFQSEPVRGLPEVPPEGERILWQGAPQWWALAREALNAHWIAVYFVALAVWRGIVIGDAQGVSLGIQATFPYLIMGAVAVGILCLIAWVLAKTTVYTITNRRVAMRIGAALTVTLNLPFSQITSADLRPGRRGTGTIALSLTDGAQLSYLVCWPHVRPWKLMPTQPALRAIPDAQAVADLLSDAAARRIASQEAVAHPPLAAVAAE